MVPGMMITAAPLLAARTGHNGHELLTAKRIPALNGDEM